ncbi:MAG: hypothetical protein QGI06_14865 [Rhodospirillales bacterium]|jgi:hypothetical protein|nr:hypothetical protein [Rhodospirillales bacterium]
MRQGKWCLGRWLAALVVAALVQAFAAAADETAPITAGPYEDPRKRFTLSIPLSADSVKPTKTLDLSIRSRSGYVINLQTAAAKPNLTLEAMRAKLEEKYLGEKKIWSQRLGEANTKVAGLPTFDGLYQGNRTRTRVVIARGRRTEFVFMFFSPQDLYDQLVLEFDSVLASFRPALAEAWGEPAPQPAAAKSVAAAKPVMQASRPMARQRFVDPKFGFSIDYPTDWMAHRTSESSVIFSGAKGSPAYYSTVSVQNARPETAGTPTQVVGAVLADLKSQLASEPGGVTYLGERPYRYERNGLRLEGREFLVTYTRGSQRFKQLTVIVPRPGRTVVHIWSYASPEDRFQEYQAIAEAMLKSWTIEVPGR